MVPFAGYSMPVQYEGIKAEHEAVRTRVGLFDVSHMGELFLEGPGAVETADYLVTNDVSRLEDGKALYTLCCDERGVILDDLIVYRRSAERVLIVCNAGNRDKITVHVAAVAQGRCRFTDASDATALLALQGPKAVDVVAAAGAPEATSLGS
ncbi:MAG: glycine cleavage system aminomethyltransferase GcvT, partial [Polyangiaceae bacterium]|nr:glycine cleavage system aminomethyltransferase GcvT [Polyangiaceae bacterium]